MLVGRTLGEFQSRPDGGYVAGSSWLYFALDPSLFGFVLWGAPSREDVEALMRLIDGEFERPPHAVLVDVAGVDVMSPPAFEVIASFVERRFAELSKSVTRAALVRPHGFNGALASGFFSAVSSPFEVSYADDVAGALRALGRSRPREEAGALADARASVEGVPLLLRALRLHLDAQDSRPSLEHAATSVGVSVRTLQRELQRYETSYVAEVQDARIRKAERLLLETDESLTSIALDVGCSSPQHFSSLFRKRRGTTPTEFRNNRRALGYGTERG